MKIKIDTSAKLKKNIKGTRREGQRVVEKGTEPCILWAIDEMGPKFRETEAHITIKEDELKISIPENSKFNNLIASGDTFHFVATFMTGKMSPLCVSLEPATETKVNGTSVYACTLPYKTVDDVQRYIKAYRLSKDKKK